MTNRSRTRLVVLQVLVLSLLAALVGRLWYMQVVAGHEYAAEASENRIREVVTPAVRGAILDDRGRPLVQNRTSLVVSVDRSVLLDLPDDGEKVVRKLATVLGIKQSQLERQLTLCGAPDAAKPPVCWNGSPYQPIPVAEDVPTDTALEVMERSEEFPGVTADMTGIRDYPQPYGARAAQVLGYVGPISAEELEAAEQAEGRRGSTYTNFDIVGKAGLEQVYDDYLRGRPGIKKLAVDSAGNVTGTVAERRAQPGNHLVTSIDAHVQKVVEDQLKAAIERAHQPGANGTERSYPADTGAAVVMEVDTGRVVAMASYPDYDPSIWVGGVSNKQYRQLTNDKSNYPFLNRAISGEYAPASTFKVVTASAAAAAGFALNGLYECAESFTPPGSTQVFTNFEAGMNEMMTVGRAIEVSCNTVFFKLAYDMYVNEGGLDAGPNAPEYLFNTASSFGYGKKTGIDLPGEADGRVPDREWRQEYWEANKDTYCNFEKEASPQELASDYLRQLNAELCVDGYQMRPGDAIQAAIGQGDVLATPLQVARAYAAIANGGTLYKPRVAKAVMTPDGKVVKKFAPKAQGKVGASQETLAYIRSALANVPVQGSASYRYADFPLTEIPVAAKTGTGQVGDNEPTTSWYASYAPANNPKYVVVMTVPEGGTGSGTSAPSVNEIYRALFGIEGMTVDPKRAVLPHGRPVEELPTINPDGTIEIPKDDGLPGSKQTGIPVVPADNKNPKKQNRRRPRGSP
ncbi:MAG TPA: penicillin-binding protein 2 [Actinomycetes bacterium]|nr:penicillin-binding protein 2 [Actinomycetes bacterium]